MVQPFFCILCIGVGLLKSFFPYIVGILKKGFGLFFITEGKVSGSKVIQVNGTF